MSDILSQNEIDELLKALNSGEINASAIKSNTSEKKIRLHDFRRASKFSKDHIKTLSIIHENYARLVTNLLTGFLRMLVQIDLLEVQPMPYGDFINAVPSPVILAFIDFAPMNGSLILEMSPSIVFAIVDRILGGKGNLVEKMRDFTEIERAIIERILNQILNLLRDSWDNVVKLKPRLERIETNPQFAQILSENETVALITFAAKVGEVDGMMNLCIPHMVVKPIIPKLSTKYWYSLVRSEGSPLKKECIEQSLENMHVPVIAVLGKTTVTVNDIIELQVGDVLPLNTSINNELEVYVGNLPKFRGKAGARRNRNAISITGIIGREDDSNE